jgi:D-glycero-alpha-D-manno-heptose-7-phosphate kinase
LGSSAAVCVNLLKTLSVFLERELSEQDLAETAFHIAKDILRKPVGKQDEYAVAIGGLNVVHFQASGVTVEPLALSADSLADLEQNLMLFFTGSARDSSEILAEQDRSVRSSEEDVVGALTALKELVLPMREALDTSDLGRFGRLLDESWKIKKKVSGRISNPRIDQIYDAALAGGALGGKVTGAGGGGFLLLYCEKQKQDAVRAAMRKFGLKEMKFRFDLAGTKVVYNNPFYDSDAHGGIRWVFMASS